VAQVRVLPAHRRSVVHSNPDHMHATLYLLARLPAISIPLNDVRSMQLVGHMGATRAEEQILGHKVEILSWIINL